MIKYKFWSPTKQTDSDVIAVNYLLRLLLPNESVQVDMAGLNEIAEKSRLLLALTEEDLIIGIAMLAIILAPTGRVGRIEDIVVHDKFRGQSIGTSLITKLITEARSLNLQRIDLTSGPARITANKMYPRLGFSLVKTNVYRLFL